MPALPPVRVATRPGIPLTNAARRVTEQAATTSTAQAQTQAQARARFLLRGREIIAQMKNYTLDKLRSIASNPNRGPAVQQAAKAELERRRLAFQANRGVAPVAAPSVPFVAMPAQAAAPVPVLAPFVAPIQAPAAINRSPVAPAAGVRRVLPAPTFGGLRVTTDDNLFDALGEHKAEAILLGLGLFAAGTYAGPPLLRRLTR